MPVFETIETLGVPVKIFTDQIEDQARQQLIDLAESGLVLGHIAAMLDVHYGMGATVGSVFASEHYICPNAVGLDIEGIVYETNEELRDEAPQAYKEINTAMEWQSYPDMGSC